MEDPRHCARVAQGFVVLEGRGACQGTRGVPGRMGA